MVIKISKFKLPALERLSKIIDYKTGTEITDLFRKAGFEDIKHDGGTKWRFLYQTFNELQNKDLGQYIIVKFLETVCDPQEFFENPNHRKIIVGEINTVLAFNNLKINDQGKAESIPEKHTTISDTKTHNEKLFDQRDYHEQIIVHAKIQFISNQYFNAINECCKTFDNYVKSKSKIDSHGYNLMSKALSPNGPLKLNPHITETEKNQQAGLMHMCMGLMYHVRNPTSHETQQDLSISREDALDIMSFISYLFKQIDNTNIKKSSE